MCAKSEIPRQDHLDTVLTPAIIAAKTIYDGQDAYRRCD
jgi:hypothetical protein